MKKNTAVDTYLQTISDPERHEAMTKLRNELLSNLPKGYEENFAYKMPIYAVPLSAYPQGYHCQPNTPLMLIGLSNAKNYISLHHMGLYGHQPLLDWFTAQYALQSKAKLDMGKGCVRFKKMDQIPYPLIGELASKISPKEWIEIYERAFRKK